MIRTTIWLTSLVAVHSATAQSALYRDETGSRLPPGLAGQCMDAAAGDADGDGDLDIALAMEFRRNLLLVNDGSGNFELDTGRLPNTAHDSEDVAFADFDGDGDADLVFVSEDDLLDELFLNDGNGLFSDASERLMARDVSNALAVTDFDADGSPDLLTGNAGINRILINDGMGRFVDRTADLWPQTDDSRTQDLELADVDGDGDLDVVVGNEGQNQLFVQMDGILVDVTSGSLPQLDDETREIKAADLDGDGDLDLIVANVGFLMSASLRDHVLLNDGNGVFVVSGAAFPESGRNNFSIQLTDLDGDGDQDVIVPDSDFAVRADDARAEASAVLNAAQQEADFLALLNDGRGAFEAAEVGHIFSAGVDGNGFDVEVADFDADGAADLFLCNRAMRPDGDEAARTGGLQRLLMRVAQSGAD